jgi:hypothetical protein
MPDQPEPTVLILDVESEPQQLGPDGRPIHQRGVMDAIRKLTGRAVPVAELQQNMTGFLTGIQEVIAKSDEMHGGFRLDTVEIDAQITADGKFALMGSSVGMSGSAGIKFVLKRGGG